MSRGGARNYGGGKKNRKCAFGGYASGGGNPLADLAADRFILRGPTISPARLRFPSRHNNWFTALAVNQSSALIDSFCSTSTRRLRCRGGKPQRHQSHDDSPTPPNPYPGTPLSVPVVRSSLKIAAEHARAFPFWEKRKDNEWKELAWVSTEGKGGVGSLFQIANIIFECWYFLHSPAAPPAPPPPSSAPHQT